MNTMTCHSLEQNLHVSLETPDLGINHLARLHFGIQSQLSRKMRGRAHMRLPRSYGIA